MCCRLIPESRLVRRVAGGGEGVGEVGGRRDHAHLHLEQGAVLQGGSAKAPTEPVSHLSPSSPPPGVLVTSAIARPAKSREEWRDRLCEEAGEGAECCEGACCCTSSADRPRHLINS